MKTPVLVGIGGANVDICGHIGGGVTQRDSNMGAIHFSAGGVCRNVCENAARMGAAVRLISAIGTDHEGERVLLSCRESGVDDSLIARLPDCHTGIYLSIHGDDGDMTVAVNDMTIIDRITPELLQPLDEPIRRAGGLMLDANLPEATLRYLGETYGGVIPLFADAVSCTKAKRLIPLMPHLHTIKPNLAELEALTGCSDVKQGIAALHRMGAAHVCVSMGSRGILYSSRGEAALSVRPHPLEQVANATGAGDSLMGGLLAGFLSGMTAQDTLRFAVTASVLTLKSEDTIRRDLSRRMIFDYEKECILDESVSVCFA